MEYKLIKTYPGSPKLGTISEPNGFKVIAPYLDTNNVDNYSEYWEKVRERDYEILMMMNPNIRTPSIPYRIESISQSNCIARYANGHVIHSVKRLSDGVIFTVEDRIDRSERLYKNNIIRGFNIGSDGKILVSINDVVDRSYKESKGCCISIVEHSLKFLFNSEDGVDMNEGDIVYYTELDDDDMSWKIQSRVLSRRDTRFIDDCTIKAFSNEKELKKYILFNKPCVSLNHIFANSNLSKNEVIGKGLIQLIEKEINGI